jgi:thiol:disulfide interchange protein
MSQKAFRTFRFLAWAMIAFFWMYVIFRQTLFMAQFSIAFFITFAALFYVQGLQVFYLVMKDAERVPDITEVYERIKREETMENNFNNVSNHRKLYKAMSRLDDIECC